MRSSAFSLSVLLFCALATSAQEPPAPKKGADLSLTAVGRQHHPIRTSSKEAQEFFDQGLTLLYGFNHEEAALSFQKASQLDPASPMPLWGYAMAIGPNYNIDVDAEREKLAWQTIQKAKALSGKSPQVEQDYVAALAARYSSDEHPDFAKLAQEYAAAMKSLHQKYPDDLDAATLYAESLMDLRPWKLWSLDGQPAEGTLEIVAVLESVLARDPLHAGANHFYIHAVEASPDPGRALMSAHRLETLVPQAGHLVHMPAHIYERTGFYESALQSNLEAAKVDREYAKQAEAAGTLYDLMYHSHNEHFGAMAACMAGNYSAAKRQADAMAARLMPHAAMMPMLDAFIMTPIWVDARFGKWKEILERPEPAKELAGTHAMWRYSRALAYAHQGNLSQAQQERDLLSSERSAFSPDAHLGEQNTAQDVLGVALHVTEARIAAAQNQTDAAINHWQQAVAAQDLLHYDEPADWYYPVRESFGGYLLTLGKASDAELVFREDLRRHPRNPRSLYGLKEALRAQGKESDALWVEKAFEASWNESDTHLTAADL